MFIKNALSILFAITVTFDVQNIAFSLRDDPDKPVIEASSCTILTEHRRVKNGDHTYNKTFVPFHKVEPVMIKCDAVYSQQVLALPKFDPQVFWFRNEEGYEINTLIPESTSKYIIQTTVSGSHIRTSLTITSPGGNDAGVYRCSFRFDGKTFSRDAFAYMAPVIDNDFVDAVSVSVKEGNPGQIECKVQGYPLPSISWEKANSTLWIPESVQKGNITDDKVLTVTSQFLQFSMTNRTEHRHFFWCRAINNIGVDRAVIFYRVKDPLAPLWPTIGLVILFAILAGFIGWAEIQDKKRKAAQDDLEKSEEKPETVKSSDEKEKEEELRQRFV